MNEQIHREYQALRASGLEVRKAVSALMKSGHDFQAAVDASFACERMTKKQIVAARRHADNEED